MSIRILSDSTNTKSSFPSPSSPGKKATPSSIVLSLTHAHSHSSPTASPSSAGIAFPAIEELDVDLDSVQKPNAKPGKRHYTCLSLLKTQNQLPHPTSSSGGGRGADAQRSSVKKRQRTTSSGSQRLGAGPGSATRKRLVLGLLGCKQQRLSTRGPGVGRSTSQGGTMAPSKSSSPEPSLSTRPRSLTDLIFIEALCKSIIHHWTHAPIEGVPASFAVDKELVGRMNEVLVRHGRRGVVLAIAALGQGNGALNVDDMEMDVDVSCSPDDSMAVDEPVPPTSTSTGSPTVALSEQVAFATLPAACRAPLPSPPPSPPRPVHARTRTSSILAPPHRSRPTCPPPFSPSKSKSNAIKPMDIVPKSITHIVAIAILRQRNKTRTKKRRVLSVLSSLATSDGRSSLATSDQRCSSTNADAAVSDGDDEDEEAAPLREGARGVPVKGGMGRGSPLVREVV